jgi:CxxC motif-containing protein (DUF1111 family)
VYRASVSELTRAVLGALVAVVALTLLIAACTDDAEQAAGTTAPARTPAELAASGGDATVDNAGAQAFAQPVNGLDRDEQQAFVVGNNFFNDNWVTAPASTTARDGLGALFNAQSCSSCHFKDGRAEPPSVESPEELGLLLRLSVPGEDDHGGPAPHPVYGGQLQDRAVAGAPIEGTIGVSTTEVRGAFEDGTPYTLQAPGYTVDEPGYGPLSPDTMISPRIAPPVFGVGLLEAVTESTVRELAAAQAEAGEGISGRPNVVWSPSAGDMVLGRFGWKANVATVEEQTAGAFVGDVGITSWLHPEQSCTSAQLECLAAPNGGDPEVSDDKLDRVVFYTRTLAVPARRDVGDATTARGEDLFEQLNCSACHVSELRTGDADVEALSNQTIRPYTDLLLHDMGPGLADGRPDGEAGPSEWRTAPLWGIGLTDEVNGHTRFLHDGRARDLTEAILWHGGEAEAAREGFLGLSRPQRDDLIAFLNSL